MNPSSPRETLHRCLLAAGVFALLLFFFSPPWSVFTLWSQTPKIGFLIELRRGAAVLGQVAHPGAPVADTLHQVIQWRLLFPILGHWLALPPAVLFALAPLGAFLSLAYLVAVLRRHSLDWTNTTLSTLLFGASSWFFTSTGWLGYFDSWLILGLLLIAFHPARWALWLSCLLTPWVDERVIFAAPLALLCRYVSTTHIPQKARTTYDWKIHAAIPATLLGLFTLVRLVLLSNQSGAGATVRGYFATQHTLEGGLLIAAGLWEGLRFAWFLLGVAVVMLWRKNPRHGLLLALAIFTLAIAGLATAQDYSRSIAVLLPAAVLGALLLADLRSTRLSRVLALTTGAALLVPAHHVMSNLVKPIYYLPHELAALDQDPQFNRPEFYQLQAIQSLERGDFPQAETQLAIAIAIAKNPASPARQRGIVYASTGRWKEALPDFSLALDHDSSNPEAWLMRAQARFALGDSLAAREDLDSALALAPASWSDRPDVARFRAKLARPPAP